MSAQIEAMCRLLEGSGDMTPMATRQILAVMATPANRPTTDHGAAGFCTDHGQVGSCPQCAHPWRLHRMGGCEFDWMGQPTLPCGCDSEPPMTPQPAPDERTETVARVLWSFDRPNYLAFDGLPNALRENYLARAAAVVAALDDESARLRAEVERAWAGRKVEQQMLRNALPALAERDALAATLARVEALANVAERADHWTDRYVMAADLRAALHPEKGTDRG